MRAWLRWFTIAILALAAGGTTGRAMLAEASSARPPAADSRVSVIVTLRAQPYLDAAQLWQAAYQPLLAAAAQAAAPPALAAGPLTHEAETALAQASAAANAQAGAAQAQAAQVLEQQLSQMRRGALLSAQPALEASQAPLIAYVQSLGGEVRARGQLVNALAARLPPEQVPALRAHPDVAAVDEEAVATGALDHSAPSLGANTFWDHSLTGGPAVVAVIDTGVDATHPALTGHILAAQRFAASGCINTSNDPTADDRNGHGTHLAGIVASQDGTYRGVAYGLGGLLNAKAGFDLDGVDGGPASMCEGDSRSAVDWALFDTSHPSADVLNLSFALCTTDDDTPWARFWDSAVSAGQVTAAVAAGNTTGGCSTITSPAIAYNVLSVANVDDRNNTSRGDDVINATSNHGPTAGGRRKPDLAAPGTLIDSTNNNWEGTSPDFVSLTGTSMAAPHVAGAAALLLNAGVADPRAVKAILINTAEDRPPAGWDPAWGWGYVDLAQAYVHRGDYALASLPAASRYVLFKGPALNGDKATLVWNRRVDYTCPSCAAGGSYPLTDLNLRLYNAADNALLAQSLSAIDNVEQVTAGSNYDQVVVRVDLSGTVQGAPAETFALATEEGFSPAAGPSVAAATNGPVLPLGAGQAAPFALVNTGDLPLYNLQITVTLPAGVTLVAGNATQTLAVLRAGEAFSPPITLRLEQNSPQTIQVNVSGTGYGSSYDFALRLVLYPEQTRLWLPMVRR